MKRDNGVWYVDACFDGIFRSCITISSHYISRTYTFTHMMNSVVFFELIVDFCIFLGAFCMGGNHMVLALVCLKSDTISCLTLSVTNITGQVLCSVLRTALLHVKHDFQRLSSSRMHPSLTTVQTMLGQTIWHWVSLPHQSLRILSWFRGCDIDSAFRVATSWVRPHPVIGC